MDHAAQPIATRRLAEPVVVVALDDQLPSVPVEAQVQIRKVVDAKPREPRAAPVEIAVETIPSRQIGIRPRALRGRAFVPAQAGADVRCRRPADAFPQWGEVQGGIFGEARIVAGERRADAGEAHVEPVVARERVAVVRVFRGDHETTSASTIHVEGARPGSHSSSAMSAPCRAGQAVVTQAIEARLQAEVPDQTGRVREAEARRFDLADQFFVRVQGIEDRIAIQSLALAMRQAHGAVLRVDDQGPARPQRHGASRRRDDGATSGAKRRTKRMASTRSTLRSATGRWNASPRAHSHSTIAQTRARHGKHLGAAVDGDTGTAEIELGGQTAPDRAPPRGCAAGGARR